MAYFINGIQYTEQEYKVKVAEIKSHVAVVNDYIAKVNNQELSMEDIPEEYYLEVYFGVYGTHETVTETSKEEMLLKNIESSLSTISSYTCQFYDDMKADIETNAIDSFTIELIETGLL